MDLIFHITPSAWWNQFSARESYASKTLSEEGFIHCSTRQQISGVLERYFTGQKDLLLLHINPQLLKAELKFEPSTNDELFPHVYGKINREAIIKVEPIAVPH